MKRSLAVFFPIALSCILQGCLRTSERNLPRVGNKIAEQQWDLVPSGTIDIPIDTASQNASLYPVYYTNDTAEYYLAGNEFLNSIDFYDLKKKKLVKRNVYPKKGENGMTSTLRIYVKSLDSIYVFSKEEYQMVLTNYSGEYLGRYNVNVMAVPNMPATSFNTNLAEPFKVKDDYAYFGFWVNGDPRFQPGHKTLAKYHLPSNEYQEFGAPFPAELKPYIYFNALPDFTFGHGNNIVVRFGGLPFVYAYDSVTQQTSRHWMKSTFQVDSIVPNKVAVEFRDVDHDFEELRQDQYGGVYYDPYAHLYYSIFIKGIPILDSVGNKHSFEDKPVSIILFNENFEYCGEYLLPRDIYFWRDIIPSRNGLLIPTSDPENPVNDPRVLQFQIFKPRQRMVSN